MPGPGLTSRLHQAVSHQQDPCLPRSAAGDQQHSMVFDAGPSGELWARNASQMEALGTVVQPEAFVLSHWHVDHSGGLISLWGAPLRQKPNSQSEAAETGGYGPAASVQVSKCGAVVCRPYRRGFTLPTGKAIPFTMEATLEEIKGAGGKIKLSKEPHTLLDDFFFVSGEIPRQMPYEFGLPGHVTQQADGSWKEDLLIMDERYLAVKVKGLGPIVFSACSHAGIVNVMKDLQSKAGRLHAVMGGFHLAGASVEGRIADTVQDIVAMDPQLVLAGHCTGWRAKAALVNALPGRYQPCVVGAVFNFVAKE
eukprot:jgi/Astpho2/3194/e_gw1.00052.51.1_t